jgi:hypothetical protein
MNLSSSAAAALAATLGLSGCIAERDYSNQWDRGQAGDIGIGVPIALEVGEGAMQGDMGRVVGIDGRTSSIDTWGDVEYTSLTLNVDRGTGGTGFTTLDMSGVGLADDRFASGEIVTFDVANQDWNQNVYVNMIGCSDLQDDHWDASADKLEVRLDPETPENAKRVDYRAHFPAVEGYDFGMADSPEQTVSGSAVIDMTNMAASNSYYE